MKTLTKPLLLLGVMAATGLGACSHGSDMVGTPSHRMHPVKVAETVERLELYSRPNGLELSARDQNAVLGFLQGYAATGSGPIHINRPAGALTGLGVQQTDQVLGRLMARAGLNPSAAQGGEYFSRPGDPAPVVVSYRTLRTVPQDCGGMSDISRSSTNAVSPNFGCFASANLAAMISDPRQLIEPYPSDFSNAQRRQVVYDKYIKGEATGSVRPEGQETSSQNGN